MTHMLDYPLTRFVETVSVPDEEIDLPRAALTASLFEYPDLDIEPFLESLDALAARVRARARGSDDAIALVRALTSVLLRDGRIRGDRKNYYDPRNSFVHEVLERRAGIPVSIGILYMGVGARAGVALGGTALPMHFVVRVLGVDPPRFVDCFNGGRLLSAGACLKGVSKLAGGAIETDASMLDVVANASVLTRFLTNLRLIYFNLRQYDKGLAVLDRLLVLNPMEPSLMRERGLVRFRLGKSDLARRDLLAYLDRESDADDAPQIRELLRKMR